MDSPYRIPIYSLAVFAAVMMGVFLGNGAISSINPVHFQGAAVHPRDRGAAVDPDAVSVAGPEYPSYGWADGRQARIEACEGCVTPRLASAAYAPPAPYFGSREEQARRGARELQAIDHSYDEQERRRQAAHEREESELARAAASERVERYAHYAVAAEEAPRDEPRAGPRAEPSAHPEKDEDREGQDQE